MRVRLRCTAGIHGTPWRELPEAGGSVIFERNEFGDRRDLPTDFIVDVQCQPIEPAPRRRWLFWRK